MASGEAIKKDLGLSDLFSVYVFKSKHAPFVIVQEKNVAKKNVATRLTFSSYTSVSIVI